MNATPQIELSGGSNKLDPAVEILIERIGKRARNLYETHQLLCTEAVLVTLNDALDGGLTKTQAIALSAPFCVALGESGCMCGALSGAVIACGLFLGNRQPYRHRRQIRESARRLHDEFKSYNGATCCSVLTRKVKHDKSAHFQHCADVTARTAEIAARMILKQRPELASRSNRKFLSGRNSIIGGAFMRLFHRLSH